MVKRRQPKAKIQISPLKQLRDELNISQQDLADYLGVSSRTISRWELGHSVATFTLPQMKALDRLLRSRGKTFDDLPDDFGPPNENKNFGLW